MTARLILLQAFWLITTSVEVVLLLWLFLRKLQVQYRAFALYIASTIAQSALAAWTYWYWGYSSPLASKMIWASQGVVICLRFAAIFEMARRIFSGYEGLWALAKRVLFWIGFCAMAYSFLLGMKQWSPLVLSLDRGMELATAAFVVILLLFARYYRLLMNPLDRALALGFCLYSCFYVINDSMFERFLNSYLVFWGYLDILTFLATLLIWFGAVHAYVVSPAIETGQQRLPVGMHDELSSDIDLRLEHLNKQISRFFHGGDPR